MAEEEVLIEIEAVQAVYGDDCRVIETYPPHIHVHIKPRTADVSSQQFVEAIIGMQAGLQYPEEPPVISVIDSKGLDDQRQKLLVTSIHNKAFELVSCLMLVALCEEAVETLTSMNHPDGSCPLCLDPLVDENAGSDSRPFMKLMSCFHCFHCDCIMRWWNWILMRSDKEVTDSSLSSTSPGIMQDKKGMRKMMEESMGHCPVCRKIFLAKDIEHVINLVGTATHSDTYVIDVDKDFLQSDSERNRKQKFESILKLQQENNGLIEPKRNEVLLPGVFLPQPVALHLTEPDVGPSESQSKGPVAKSGTNSDSSFNRPGPRKLNNPNRKQHKTQNSRKQGRQWIRKDNDSQN